MKPFDKSAQTITSDGTRLKTIAVRIPKDLHDALAKRAREELRSLSGQIILYTRAGLDDDAR